MVAGLLRARGYRVVRARIRDALRNSDPLSGALRWPGGITRRRVYSVAGPNSLWHIGKTFKFCVCVYHYCQYEYVYHALISKSHAS